jgi:hypothetical protein
MLAVRLPRWRIDELYGTHMACLCRVVTLFALEEPFDREDEPAARWRHAAESGLAQHNVDIGAASGPLALGGLAPLFQEAGTQMPVRVAHEDRDPDDVYLAEESADHGAFGQYRLTAAALSLYATQTGGVLALSVTLEAEEVGDIAQLLRDVAFRKKRAKIDGMGLLAHAVRLGQTTNLDLKSASLGQVYQLILTETLEGLLSLKSWPQAARSEETKWDKAQRFTNYLVAKNPTRSLRLGMGGVIYPPEANANEQALSAVTSHTSVIINEDFGFRLGALYSAVQCLTTATRARYIRNLAYSALTEVRLARDGEEGTASQVRSRLRELASTVSSLRLEQSFALRAYIDVAALIPDQRFAAYHHTLAAAMRLPEASAVVDDMLTDLSTALESLRIEASIAETEVVERRTRTVTWISAAVAVVAVPATLIFGFLGINVSPVSGDRSFFEGPFLGVYAALLVLFILAILVGWEAGRRQSRKTP